jgi:hypothetical protein
LFFSNEAQVPAHEKKGDVKMKRLKIVLVVMVGVALVIAPVMLAFAQGEGADLTTVCHYLPDGTEVQIAVPDDSLIAHLNHGDTLGACSDPINEHPMVEICHQAGQSVVTLLVDARSLAAHLRHGDTLGPCPS